VHTTLVTLRISNERDEARAVPMRFSGSHQAGYRLFFGALSDADLPICEATEPDHAAFRFFDAIASYRQTIEPDGWRLLHAVARTDCWPKPDELGTRVQRLFAGTEATQPLDAFAPATFDEVVSLDEQRLRFAAWQASLSPVSIGRVRPKAGHEHEAPGVTFGPLSALAGKVLREADGQGGSN
jgi:hypothetical protein